MKILFCTTAVPEAMEFRVKELSAAGNRFQLNMIKQMRKAGMDVSLLSYVGVAVSEKIRQETCVQNTTPWGAEDGMIYKDKGFFPAIRAYRKEMKKRAKEADILLCYNVVHVWMNLPQLARAGKKKSVLVLADYSGPESYKSLVRKLYAALSLYTIRKFDVVAGLSANVEKKLKKRQKFILMEGGIDEALYQYFAEKKPMEKEHVTLMYSGLLSPVTGVDRLLAAMKLCTKEKLRLVITGKGELEEAVTEAAKKDSRIHFYGLLQYEEYLEMLSLADGFINPRNMSLPENQNNFPSKIFDYLAAGRPVISTRFIGFEKFAKVICFCEDTPEALAEAIQKFAVSGTKEAEEQFERARRFAEQFLWDKQMKRLLEES